MIITQFIISLSIIAVNLTIIPLGLSYFLKKGYLLGLVLYAVMLYPMLKYFGLVGINLALIIVELALLIIFVSFIRRKLLVHVGSNDEKK
jgi:PST family polysaccharide transporter